MSLIRFSSRFTAPVRQTVARRSASTATPSPLSGPIKFSPEVKAEMDAVREHGEKTAELWRRISLYGMFPILAVTSYVVYGMAMDHLHHLEEHPPKFKKYDYLRIRNRPFPFGDGDHSLFHNPLVNPDPEE
ncbi:hypothetical protein H4R33_004779 [Dimargaris cristalligena]|uniref:Cytochrome c oxidase subunit 13, mitochondrial n=1 Tax=Dimargaris cristalligena TaxID=215637 RepID=A0A4P9ZYI4_9FUNG|nr:hypothetical protein H4R33_004779 [Dimargaris cristalligena]RKP38002.1 cytochrome c oxidase, subunit VIa [Dimargaris cristalligena]|eukprot:RKP38002.1 cytochrome c oxidase, subunit VIa [Dimargaris cristalligena]